MMRHELSEAERTIIEGMRQPFAICQFLDTGVVTLAVSDGFCEMFGYKDRAQAYSDMNQNMFKDIHPDDTARFTNAILRFGSEDERLELVYRTKKGDGSGYRVIHASGDHMHTDDGTRLAQIWLTDEGDYVEKGHADQIHGTKNELPEESLDYAARYDYLTGLPNLSSFFERAEIQRKVLLDGGRHPALLYVDLNGMKHFNHKYGFSRGDQLLRYFAKLLGKTFGTDNCCHVSADRFAVISDEAGIEDRIGTLFLEWQYMGKDRHLPICVGIYPNQMEEVPVGMAYDRAKIACDAIKGTYSSSYNYYSDELTDELEKQQYILETFETALANKWIKVYYQPIVRAVNGKVCDEEALARWIDPKKGFLSPADFIPFLEDAGVIYKLDLYVLDRVLEYIKIKESEGFYIVPNSINLSRSDFDACDMVEEVRKRVDAAGVSRKLISIEITESIIGSDFEFMKAQVERFQALGFPVWMDDFGSGYSSLDVLQSIKFDLLKFDMGFMRKLDESIDGRIILTELMKMALALGVDTICEGVETEEQVRFLQEIGCSKLQGFYFSKPNPVEYLIDYHRMAGQNGYENPEESEYYGQICGVNLYDVGVIAREENTSLQNAYSTLPMCVIEIKDDSTRFVRTNQSYRDFFKRFFGLDLSNLGPQFAKYDAAFMHNVLKTCCDQGIRTFYDEKMPDGSIIHSFARRIGANPVSGNIAVAIAVLSIREPNEKLMTEQVLSVIEEFGECMPGGFFIYKADDSEELLYANKAVCDIFGCKNLNEFKALTGFTFRGMAHPDDHKRVSASVKQQVKESQLDLDYVEYRIIRKDGETRWIGDYGHRVEYDDESSLYYVFISDITDKHEQAAADEALRSAVIEALSRSYDSVWLVTDMETQQFELSYVDEDMVHVLPTMEAMKIPRFYDAFEFYSSLVLEEDRQQFLDSVTPQCIIRNTMQGTTYSVHFRRVFDDEVRPYRIEFFKLNLGNGIINFVVGFKDLGKESLDR